MLLDQESARAAAVATIPPAGQLGNLPLGIRSTNYVQFIANLAKGDVLLLYTDSLSEAEDSQRRPLGEHGLLDLVCGLDSSCPEKLVDAVLQALSRYRNGPPQDDQTLLVLHHNAANPPERSLGKESRQEAQVLGF